MSGGWATWRAAGLDWPLRVWHWLFAVAVIVLLTVMAVQTARGLFIGDDILREGPWSVAVSEGRSISRARSITGLLDPRAS